MARHFSHRYGYLLRTGHTLTGRDAYIRPVVGLGTQVYVLFRTPPKPQNQRVR